VTVEDGVTVIAAVVAPPGLHRYVIVPLGVDCPAAVKVTGVPDDTVVVAGAIFTVGAVAISTEISAPLIDSTP
jgi:hypothetical protein